MSAKPLTPAGAASVGSAVMGIIRGNPGLWFADLLLVGLIYAANNLAPAFIIRLFFDVLSGKAAAGFNVWTAVALTVAALLARTAARLGFYLVDTPFLARAAALLRKNILGSVLRQPGAAALPESPGEAVSRFRNDVSELPNFVIMLNDMTMSALTIMVSVALMASTDWKITVISLVPVALVGGIASVAKNRIEHYRDESRKATGRITGFIGEFFGAVQAIKVAGSERPVLARFDQLNGHRSRVSLRERLFGEILDSLFRNTSTLSTGVILLLAAGGMGAGKGFSVGDFSFFVSLLGRMGGLTTFVGMLTANWKQLGVSVARLQRLMGGAPADELTKPSGIHLDGSPYPVNYPPRRPEDRLESLEVRDLRYRHPGSDKGITGISFKLERGSLTVLTGRVGSGKTTVLRAMLGLLQPGGGQILWNGEPVLDPASWFLPPRCAYTAQVPRLFSDTLRDNLLLGLVAGDGEIAQAAHLAVLDGDLGALEDGLGTMVGARGVKLSGGQVQRAAAARMFLRRPELLVFDDLSSALDVNTELELWARIYGDPDRPTCLAVSHRRPALSRADRVVVLKDGRVESVGRLEELLESSEEMRAIWREVPRE